MFGEDFPGELRDSHLQPHDGLKEDAALMVRLSQGDLQALGSLYDRHARSVYRTAMAITRDESAAQDILQDTFLHLLKFASGFDPTRPLMPWLYRVTVNLCYSYYRGRAWSFLSLEYVIDKVVSTKPAPETRAMMKEFNTAILNALGKLSWQHRLVVVLYYVDELSIHEIAELLGCPVGTVKSRLFYSRRALRNILVAEKSTHLDYAYGLR